MSEFDEVEDAHPVTIGLYAPSIQGYYFGELINQLRQLCELKEYRLVVIRTQTLGAFDYEYLIDSFDAVIIIRNAIHSRLANELVRRCIPCVSIAFDYFPTKIPVVSTDNEKGVQLAFEYLKDKGHDEVLFVGDLSQYDLRRRYECFCDSLEANGVQPCETHLIQVSDTLFSGGYAAAEHYLQQNLSCKAILFGAGLTGIGFIQYLEKIKPGAAKALDLVCFDAIALIPELTPELAAIDQNLHLIAYRALNILDAQRQDEWDGSLFVGIPPKIITPQEADHYDAFIATCVDLPSFHNPNYMKAITCNRYEWIQTIAGSNLDKLMTLAPAFERYLSRAFLSRIMVDKLGRKWVKHIKTLTLTDVIYADSTDKSSIALLDQYPPKTIPANEDQAWNLSIHLLVSSVGGEWGLLTIQGSTLKCQRPACFFAFGGFIESILEQFSATLSAEQYRNKLESLQALQEKSAEPADEKAIIEWNMDAQITTWNDAALSLLEFVSSVDKAIFRNIDIVDRLHQEDVEMFREEIYAYRSSNTAFSIKIRLRTKSGKYHPFFLSVKEQEAEDSSLIVLSLFDASESDRFWDQG